MECSKNLKYMPFNNEYNKYMPFIIFISNICCNNVIYELHTIINLKFYIIFKNSCTTS